jgi:hypothetical protein
MLLVASPYVSPRIKWLRFDTDIIHFKPIKGEAQVDLVTLSKVFARPGQNDRYIRKWNDDMGLNTTTAFGSSKWSDRPISFSKIKHLAISRDFLCYLPDDYEPFIRHFLPNLETLIVLIDDDTDIEDKWNLYHANFRAYEKPPSACYFRATSCNPRGMPRFDFAQKSVGPFKRVKLNDEYAMEIEYEMRKRFAKEEEDYNVS